LREVAAGMVGLSDKRNGKNQPPKKEHFMDANKIKVEFFEEIYNNLLKNIALFCRTVE
jgi:hypothetical protein